jgi:hypothetical protein
MAAVLTDCLAALCRGTLQNHYPERLGKAVSYIPPIIFDIMWRVSGGRAALSRPSELPASSY